jgi:hypothetical protein
VCGYPAATAYIDCQDGQLHAIAHSSQYNHHLADEDNNRFVYGVESLSASDAFGIYDSLVLKKYLVSGLSFVFLVSISFCKGKLLVFSIT